MSDYPSEGVIYQNYITLYQCGDPDLAWELRSLEQAEKLAKMVKEVLGEDLRVDPDSHKLGHQGRAYIGEGAGT